MKTEFNGTALAPYVFTQSNWYAVYTRPSHEKRVSDHFAARSIDHYLPTYRATRRWKNRCRVELELPLFPTYIFACIAWQEHARVLAVPSVISIVGNGREAVPVPATDIESLRSGLTLRSAQPHPFLNIGEPARIKYGPLAGWEGIVLRKANGCRVVLTLQQIMKSVVVEVDPGDLEPISAKCVVSQ